MPWQLNKRVYTENQLRPFRKKMFDKVVGPHASPKGFAAYWPDAWKRLRQPQDTKTSEALVLVVLPQVRLKLTSKTTASLRACLKSTLKRLSQRPVDAALKKYEFDALKNYGLTLTAKKHSTNGHFNPNCVSEWSSPHVRQTLTLMTEDLFQFNRWLGQILKTIQANFVRGKTTTKIVTRITVK